NADLSIGADVASAARIPLRSNEGLSSPGFKLHGDGFILDPEEAQQLLAADPRHKDIIKEYRNGRDLTNRPRGVWLIDFGIRTEEEARGYPVLYNLVRDRVKPERAANNDESTREKWWKFGRNREEFRPALEELSRYIATVETSKHRFFQFLDRSVAPDNMLICIASDSAFHLGVLSSRIHVTWALAAGGRLGVGNDPRYNKGVCFDAFPFPGANPGLETVVASLAEQLDSSRKDALGR